jgi:hypothetical protein
MSKNTYPVPFVEQDTDKCAYVIGAHLYLAKTTREKQNQIMNQSADLFL